MLVPEKRSGAFVGVDVALMAVVDSDGINGVVDFFVSPPVFSACEPLGFVDCVLTTLYHDRVFGVEAAEAIYEIDVEEFVFAPEGASIVALFIIASDVVRTMIVVVVLTVFSVSVSHNSVFVFV